VVIVRGRTESLGAEGGDEDGSVGPGGFSLLPVGGPSRSTGRCILSMRTFDR
jgi:hypothetical protein